MVIYREKKENEYRNIKLLDGHQQPFVTWILVYCWIYLVKPHYFLTLVALLSFTAGMLPVNTKHCMTFVQCWTNVEDVGPTLYKCYTNVLCLLGY